MAFPEKNYYYIQEVSERWGICLNDLRYYAEHGLLTIQTWLPENIVKLYRNKRTEDGDIAPVQVGVSSYKGYAVMEPDELRKIFRDGRRPVEKFKSAENSDLIKLYDPRTKFMVGKEDLVICKNDRDRFEKEYGIEIKTASEHIFTKPIHPASFPGRPSVMHKIEQELYARAKSGAVLPTLADECRYLHGWAKETMKSEQIPSWRAIGNALRTKYRHENMAGIKIPAENRANSAA